MWRALRFSCGGVLLLSLLLGGAAACDERAVCREHETASVQVRPTYFEAKAGAVVRLSGDACEGAQARCFIPSPWDEGVCFNWTFEPTRGGRCTIEVVTLRGTSHREDLAVTQDDCGAITP